MLQAPWVSRVVRLGFFAKGLIYSLIGLLAFRVAFGVRGGRLVDQSGALRAVLRQPFGQLMLVVIGVGIIGYAAYYIFEAVTDTRRKGGGIRGWTDRSLTMIKAVAYGTIGWEALRLVFINRQPSGNAEGTARTVMQFPLGDWFLILVGVGIAVYGLKQLKMTCGRRPPATRQRSEFERGKIEPAPRSNSDRCLVAWGRHWFPRRPRASS